VQLWVTSSSPHYKTRDAAGFFKKERGGDLSLQDQRKKEENPRAKKKKKLK